MADSIIPHFHNDAGVDIRSPSACASSCASARCRRSIIRTSSSTWATRTRRSAPTARLSIGSTPISARRRRDLLAVSTVRQPPSADMRVAIAGAGIAGLTSAIALAERGFEVDVYERAPALLEIGAGIQLSPNAMAVLDRLGSSGPSAGEALRARRPGRPQRRYGVRVDGDRARRGNASPLRRALLHPPPRRSPGRPSRRRRRHEAIKLHLSADVRDVADAADRVALSAGGAKSSG